MSTAEHGQVWISMAQAQDLAGCSESTIIRAIRSKQLVQRTGLSRAVPSLNRASVERWVEVRRAEAERRAADRPRRPKTAPPEDGHTWISTEQAAPIVGRSTSWLVEHAARERVPHTRRGNRLWWRLDQVQAMGRVRGTEPPGGSQ